MADLVILSIAHTPKAPGARSPAFPHVLENPYSRRICASAAEWLELAGFDVVTVEGSIRQKIAKINKLRGACLVEPHLNAATSPTARGHMVIHHAPSVHGRNLAISISDALDRGLHDAGFQAARRWGATPCPGRLVRHPELPILSDTKPPAVIPELLFVSNPDDAAFLAKSDTPERLGGMVAAGIAAWLKARR